jgi:hypothetical protein
VINNSSKAAFIVPILLELQKRNQKAVIWTKNIKYELNVVEHILKKLYFSYMRMEGKTSTAKRAAMIANFMNNPKYLFFIATMRTGSDSITLTASYINIFWGIDWNPSVSLQAQSRLVRIGQQHSVSSIILIADTEVENECWKYTKLKQELNNIALEAITDCTTCKQALQIKLVNMEKIKENTVELQLQIHIYDNITFILDGENCKIKWINVNIDSVEATSVKLKIQIQSLVQGYKYFKIHLIQLGYEELIEFKVEFFGGGNVITDDKIVIGDFITEIEHIDSPLYIIDNKTVEISKMEISSMVDINKLLDEIQINLDSPVPDMEINYVADLCDKSLMQEISDVMLHAVKNTHTWKEDIHPFYKIRLSTDLHNSASVPIKWVVLDNAGNQGDQFARIFGFPSIIFTTLSYLKNNLSMIARFRNIKCDIPIIMFTRNNVNEYLFEDISKCWCCLLQPFNSHSQFHNHIFILKETLKQLMEDVLLICETIGCSDLSSMGKRSNKVDVAQEIGTHNHFLVELEQLWTDLAPHAIRHGESSFRLTTDLGRQIIHNIAIIALKNGRYLHCNRYNAYYHGGPCSVSGTRDRAFYLTGPMNNDGKGVFIEDIVNEIPMDMATFYKDVVNMNLNSASVNQFDDYSEVDFQILKDIWGECWREEYVKLASNYGRVMTVTEIILTNTEKYLNIGLDAARKIAGKNNYDGKIELFGPFAYWSLVKEKILRKQSKNIQKSKVQLKKKGENPSNKHVQTNIKIDNVGIWDRSSILVSITHNIPLVSMVADRIARFVIIDDGPIPKHISQRFAMYVLGYSNNFDLNCSKDPGLIGRTVPGTVALERAINIANLLLNDLERLQTTKINIETLKAIESVASNHFIKRPLHRINSNFCIQTNTWNEDSPPIIGLETWLISNGSNLDVNLHNRNNCCQLALPIQNIEILPSEVVDNLFKNFNQVKKQLSNFNKINKAPIKVDNVKLTEKQIPTDTNSWITGAFTCDWPTMQRTGLVGKKTIFTFANINNIRCLSAILLTFEWLESKLVEVSKSEIMLCLDGVVVKKKDRCTKMVKRKVYKTLDQDSRKKKEGDGQVITDIQCPNKEIDNIIKLGGRVWIIEQITENHFGTFSSKDLMKLVSTLQPNEKKEFFIVKGQYQISWRDQLNHKVQLQPIFFKTKEEWNISHLQRPYLTQSMIMLRPEEGLSSAILHLSGCIQGSLLFKRVTWRCILEWRGCESLHCEHTRSHENWKIKVLDGIPKNIFIDECKTVFENYKNWPIPNVNTDLSKYIFDNEGNYLSGIWIISENALPTLAINYVRYQFFFGNLKFEQRLKKDRTAHQTQLTAAIAAYHNNTNPQSLSEFPFLQQFVIAMQHFQQQITGSFKDFGNMLYAVLYLFPWLHHMDPHDHSKPNDGLVEHVILTLLIGNPNSKYLPYEFQLQLKPKAKQDPLKLGSKILKFQLPDNSLIFMDGLPIQKFYSHSLKGIYDDNTNKEVANARAGIILQKLHQNKLLK